MELKYFPFKGNEKDKEQRWAVDAESILQRMSFLEEFGGNYSAEKVAEHYHALKLELLKISLQPTSEKKDESKAKPKTKK